MLFTPNETLVLEITSPMLWGILAVVTALSILVSVVLLYHWVSYSKKAHSVVFVMFGYIAVSLLLLATAAGAAGYYSLVT